MERMLVFGVLLLGLGVGTTTRAARVTHQHQLPVQARLSDSPAGQRARRRSADAHDDLPSERFSSLSGAEGGTKAEEGSAPAASPAGDGPEASKTDAPTVVRAEALSSCPLSRDLDEPRAAAELSRCPEYSAAACCSQREHDELDARFESLYRFVYGHCPGCLENVRKMQCAIRCAPTQRDFSTVQAPKDGVAQPTRVRICPPSCANFYTSCVNATPRATAHTEDAKFCASQVYDDSGFHVELDQFDCLSFTGPDTCGGTTKLVENKARYTPAQVVLLVALLVVVLGGGCTIFYGCGQDEEARDGTPYSSTFRPSLFVAGDTETE